MPFLWRIGAEYPLRTIKLFAEIVHNANTGTRNPQVRVSQGLNLITTVAHGPSLAMR